MCLSCTYVEGPRCRGEGGPENSCRCPHKSIISIAKIKENGVLGMDPSDRPMGAFPSFLEPNLGATSWDPDGPARPFPASLVPDLGVMSSDPEGSAGLFPASLEPGCLGAREPETAASKLEIQGAMHR